MTLSSDAAMAGTDAAGTISFATTSDIASDTQAVELGTVKTSRAQSPSISTCGRAVANVSAMGDVSIIDVGVSVMACPVNAAPFKTLQRVATACGPLALVKASVADSLKQHRGRKHDAQPVARMRKGALARPALLRVPPCHDCAPPIAFAAFSAMNTNAESGWLSSGALSS